MDWKLIVQHLPLYLKGAVVTMELTIASMFLGVAAGLLIITLRLGRVRILRIAASMYVSVIRGTPLLLQIMLIFYALPFLGINLSPMPSGILALSINLAAYMSETFRGGIQTVPQLQIGAAYLDGCTRMQCLRYIILPQAFYNILPQLGNTFVQTIKDTSMVSVITITELPSEAVSKTFREIEKKMETL